MTPSPADGKAVIAYHCLLCWDPMRTYSWVQGIRGGLLCQT